MKVDFNELAESAQKANIDVAGDVCDYLAKVAPWKVLILIDGWKKLQTTIGFMERISKEADRRKADGFDTIEVSKIDEISQECIKYLADGGNCEIRVESRRKEK